MKEKINRYLRKFGAEIHGIGYIQKLKNSDSKKMNGLSNKGY